MNLLTRDALDAWLDYLADEANLIAPRAVDGIVLYRPVAGSDEITFEYTRPKMSAKEAVFPATERILSVEKQSEAVAVTEPALEKEQVVFGLRPCDAHGFAVLDGVFLEKEPVDWNYARRREVTTLIGLACPQMWDGCFCTSMGGAPDDPSHLDVLLREVNGGYAVEAVTENGRAFVANLDLQEVDGEPPFPTLNNEMVPSIPPESWPARFADRYWDLLAERCISCRLCAYVCPTCRCFDVRDEVSQRRTEYAKYDRLRCWDSCTGTNYRLIGGGTHNQRPLKSQRLRNRFFCKFLYMHEDYGVQGCIGCGRCIEVCPVNIDIVEMLHDVNANVQAEVEVKAQV
jgi:sulfhydrogenase subunit beta (sulfur reductase)